MAEKRVAGRHIVKLRRLLREIDQTINSIVSAREAELKTIQRLRKPPVCSVCKRRITIAKRRSSWLKRAEVHMKFRETMKRLAEVQDVK